MWGPSYYQTFSKQTYTISGNSRLLNFHFKDAIDDWETVSSDVGGSDMMIVNLSPQYNMNWTNSTSPSSPTTGRSPGQAYTMGQAATSSATSFVSSLIRGFTGGGNVPNSNSSAIYESITAPKK